MPSIRKLGAVGLLALGVTLPASQAAQAESGVWVQVSPSSATAGTKISVRADCLDNSSPATVASTAFGTLTVQPWNSLLLAEVTVPPSTREGTYEVKVTCRTGATASTTIIVIVGGGGHTQPPPPPPPGPHTGGGFLAGAGADGDGQGIPPAVWFLGAAGVLSAAGVAGAVSVRRRRRVAAR